jgi:hypothetical protein
MKTTGRRKVKSHNGELLRFAVLVPHRDIRPVLYSFRRRIFAAGVLGAYSFPPVVPLSLLERPLEDPELKALAMSLRALSLEAGSGVFSADAAGPPLLISGPGGFNFWGFPLNIPVPSLPGAPFPHAAICAAAAGKDPGIEREFFLKTEVSPLLRFRAAAAANLAVRFFPGGGHPPDGENTPPYLSSRWRIGEPHWLKKVNGVAGD